MDNDRDHFGQATERLAQYLAFMDEQAVADGDAWDELAALNGPYPLPEGRGVMGAWKRLQVSLANRLLWRQHTFNAQLINQVRAALSQRSTTAGKPLVLFIVPYDVVQPRVGGAARVHALVQAMASRYRVRLVTLTGPRKEPARIPLGQDSEIICFPVSRALQDKMESNRARWGKATWLITLMEHAASVPFLSTYLERIRSEVGAVVLSGPYLAPLVTSCLPDVPLIYETHDISAEFLRHLADGPDGATALQRAEDTERKAVERSAFTVCVSEEDRNVFQLRFGVAQNKVLVVRNGVHAARSICLPPGQSHALRKTWWQDRQVVLFMGSVLAANMEAMNFIRIKLAPAFPQALFVTMGVSHDEFAAHVGESSLPANMLFTGQVSSRIKEGVLALSDVAIAPMQSGTGSSLKIPDYLAHGKPVIATDLGVRGHPELHPYITVTSREHFADTLSGLLARLAANPTSMDDAMLHARREVERTMDWSVLCDPLLRRMERILPR